MMGYGGEAPRKIFEDEPSTFSQNVFKPLSVFSSAKTYFITIF